MTEPPASPPPAPPGLLNLGLSGSVPPEAGWSRRKYVFLFALLLVIHVALVFLLGTRNKLVPRPVTGVPHLRLASNSDAFVALSDPTLFTRPNAHDLVSAFWRRRPPAPPPDFNWNEAARYLNPADRVFASGRPAGDFGADFHALVQASPGEFALNFKPAPQTIAPTLADDDALPQTTALRITGELAGRLLLTRPALPVLPRNDVLEPSRLQALVDSEGNVVSAIVPVPTTDHAADQRALQLARAFRFAPAPRLTLGDLTFVWHTVPVTTNNPP